jgi:hypothetical protein
MSATLNEAVLGTASHTVSLKPKEHGAYAIVIIPMLTALVASDVSIVGFGVVVASLAGFFAHEPLLVSLGHRGQRVRRDAPDAPSRAIGLLLLSVFAGSTVFWFGSPTIRISLAGCLVLAITCLMFAVARQHRTLGGQLLGVVGLSMPCIPILIAGGMSVQQTVVVWAVWLIGFVSTTLAVRGVIAAQKRQPRGMYWWGLGLTTAAIAGAGWAGIWLPLAALPMIAASWLLMAWPPPAKYLKRVGWALVVGTITTAVSVVFGLST